MQAEKVKAATSFFAKIYCIRPGQTLEWQSIKPMRMMMEEIVNKIKSQIADNKILIYMKGSPEMPQCGFSAKATQCLQACGQPFAFVDILQNPDIRQTLPSYANWPTFPQLYINGELVGGSDIIAELYESGELQTMVDAA